MLIYLGFGDGYETSHFRKDHLPNLIGLFFLAWPIELNNSVRVRTERTNTPITNVDVPRIISPQ